MYAVVDIELVLIRAGQFDHDSFHTLALAGGSRYLTVRCPRHPAVILDMCSILDPKVLISIYLRNEGFHSQRPSCGT